MKLNEKILYYRQALKLSQEELAERVGVSRQAVSKWELGDATPEVDRLVALAKIFGVTTDELLSEEEPGAPREPVGQDGGGSERAPGWLFRLVRRYGWLAGVYVALIGLGGILMGVLARSLHRRMFAEVYEMVGEAAGAGSPFLVFANLFVGVGAVMLAAGVVLAAVLYRKGRGKG